MSLSKTKIRISLRVTQTESKKMEKIFHANVKKKELGWQCLDKTDFKTKTRNKGHNPIQ